MSNIGQQPPSYDSVVSSKLAAEQPEKTLSEKQGRLHSRRVSYHKASQKQIPSANHSFSTKFNNLFKKISSWLSIEPVRPKYQYNATVHNGGQPVNLQTNNPQLHVWSSNPQAVVHSNVPYTVHQHFNAVPFMGNPFQVQVPNLGVVNLSQPLPFPQQTAWVQPPVYQQPAYVYQTPVFQLQTHLPVRPAVKQHIYQDPELTQKIQSSRVTERFHINQPQIDSFDKAVSVQERLYATLPRGLDSQVARAKSVHLREISQALKTHQKHLAYPLAEKQADVEHQGKVVIRNLENGMRAIDIILKTGRNYHSPEQLQNLKGLRHQLNTERALALQVMGQKGAHGLNSKINWQTATDLMRVGYSLNPTTAQYFTELDDRYLQATHDFGKGASHSVSKLIFKRNDKTIEKLFKAEDSVDPTGYQRIALEGKYLDTSRPRFAARNLAAQNLQPLLGLDMIPEMELTTHNNKVGLLMEIAKGHPPYPTDSNGGIHHQLRQNPAFARQVAKELVNAEWLDCLCGQQDRHAGNYLIDPQTGKVSLIDNDQAFYPGDDSVKKRATRTSERISDPQNGESTWHSPWPGLPALIDKQTFEKLQATNDQDIRTKLNGLLTGDEIESTIKRLTELKQYASQLAEQGYVVEDWGTWKDKSTSLGAAEFLRLRSKDQSYFNALGKLAPKNRPVKSAVAETVPVPSKPRYSSSR